MGGEQCGCKKENDCGCKKISESSNGNGHGEVKTMPYYGLSLEWLQKVKNHEPTHAIATYLTNINKSVSITMDSTKGDIKGVSTNDALSELELDEYPIIIDLKSSKPAYDRVEFVASYEDNGAIRKVRRATGDIIVNIINTRLRKALKKIVINANSDNGDNGSVITTTIKELIGTSVSVIVDDITGVIESALHGNDTNILPTDTNSSDNGANMKKGTFMSIKTYSGVSATCMVSATCWCGIEKIIGCCTTRFCSKSCHTCAHQLPC